MQPSWQTRAPRRRAHMTGCLVLCLAVLCGHLFGLPAPAIAVSEVKIAIIVPLSGRWARQGALYKAGSDMAIDEINAQGGIKALGGAKVVLVPADAGDSVQQATSAAQRVLSGGGGAPAPGAAVG